MGSIRRIKAPAKPLSELSGTVLNLLNLLSRSIPPETTQVLLITDSGKPGSSAQVHALERKRLKWTWGMNPIAAVAGVGGFAPPGWKTEGDGRTPSGIYPLEAAFGSAPKPETHMDYRQTTGSDVWVDDVGSPDYNTWTKKGETRATSFEEMERADGLYRYGIVIGYNRNPVVKGRGSAIFIHLRKGKRKPTAGCVAVAERDMLSLLAWLDARQKPLVVMGTAETIESILALRPSG